MCRFLFVCCICVQRAKILTRVRFSISLESMSEFDIWHCLCVFLCSEGSHYSLLNALNSSSNITVRSSSNVFQIINKSYSVFNFIWFKVNVKVVFGHYLGHSFLSFVFGYSSRNCFFRAHFLNKLN